MRVTYLEPEKLFVALTTYDEREIPKLAGFKWNPARKLWETNRIERAERLTTYLDPAAKAAIRRAREGDDRFVKAELDSNFDVPCPPGLAFRGYQRAGTGYAMKRPHTLIADEMGLGKTIQAIGVVNCTEAPKRVIVVCPASKRLDWRTEMKKWLTHKMNVVIVTDTWHAGINLEEAFSSGPMVVIVSYRGAVKHRAKIAEVAWDIFICDDCISIVNSKTEQAKTILGGARNVDGRKIIYPGIRAKRSLWLNGTPIVNRPKDLWTIIRRCDFGGLGRDWKWFTERYVNRPDFLGELHSYLHSTFMVRRLKKDVLTELPAKRRQVILVEPEGASAALAQEWALVSRKARELAELRHDHAVQQLNEWRGAAMTEITKIRHATAVAKAPAVVEHIFNLLDETDKIVVFAHHHDVIDVIAASLGSVAAKFDGRTSMNERDQIIKRFQTDPGARVFVGSIRAAGLGITLTAAATAVFAELDWTPAAMVQAEDRLHRIGQTESVLVQHLVIDGSIDQRMAAILIEKAQMMDQILDGIVPESMRSSILDEVLRG